MTAVIQIIMGFLGSLGFGILFNVRGKRLVAASLGGLVSWALFLLLKIFIGEDAVCYFIVSVVLSFYCEIMARIQKTPTTTFLITTLIPLIPGSGLYYTMTKAFSGEYDSFLERGVTTLSLAVALALGVIVTTVIVSLISRIRLRAETKNKGAEK